MSNSKSAEALLFCVALRVLGLPVPEVAAHGVEICLRFESELLLSQRWVRDKGGNIAAPGGNLTINIVLSGQRDKRTFGPPSQSYNRTQTPSSSPR